MTEKEHGSVAMGDTEAALEKAIDAFWNAAYQQGQETRGHDDRQGTAQKAEDGLRAAIAALSRPVQDPVAIDGKALQALRDIETAALGGYLTPDLCAEIVTTALSAPEPVVHPLPVGESLTAEQALQRIADTPFKAMVMTPGWAKEFAAAHLAAIHAAPQPAHGTSATERVSNVGVDDD